MFSSGLPHRHFFSYVWNNFQASCEKQTVVRKRPSGVTMNQAIKTLPRMKLNLGLFILYTFMHAICLAVFWTGVTWTDVGVCLGSFYLRIFGLGAGYHRYFAHRSFKTSRPMQFFLALLGTLAFQRGVLWWAETHRHHHRGADTPDDIHSPTHHGFLYSHSGWFIDKKHRHTDFSKVADLAKFPELVWLNRIYFIPNILYALLIYSVFGLRGLLWGVAVSTVLLWHGTHWIQSMSHKYGGYRRYPSADNSRNHWLLAFVTLGEFHNNHHYYPSSCKQGQVWWEIDIVYYILKALSYLCLIWDLKTPPARSRRDKIPPKYLLSQ
jgi:stearoyl-CoA desaturase (delta-9 desaturase)